MFGHVFHQDMSAYFKVLISVLVRLFSVLTSVLRHCPSTLFIHTIYKIFTKCTLSTSLRCRNVASLKITICVKLICFTHYKYNSMYFYTLIKRTSAYVSLSIFIWPYIVTILGLRMPKSGMSYRVYKVSFFAKFHR